MATYYFRNATATWLTPTNWSLSSGGPADGSTPTSSDNVIFDSNSRSSCTLNSNRDCKNISFTNWTGTFDMNTVFLRIYGSIDFGSSLFTIINAGSWQMGGTTGVMNGQTIKTNGKVVSGTLSFGYTSGSTSVVLLDDVTCVQLQNQSPLGSTILPIFTGQTLYVLGNIITSSAGRSLHTTTPIKMIGTGSITTFSSNAELCCDIEINTAGTITFVGSIFTNQNFKLKHTSGTVITAGSTFTMGSNTTLDTNNTAMTFNTLTLNGTGTVLTLITDCRCNQFNMGVNAKTINGANIYNAGNLYAPSNTGNVQGTSKIIMNGTGTINAAGGAYFGIDIVINTAGTITLSSFNYGLGTFKYISGTIVNSGTLTIVQGSATLDTAGMSFLNVSTNGSYTNPISLPTILTVTGKLSFPSNTTIINGAGGFTCSSLSIGSATLTLPEGITNTVTATMSCLTATLAAKALINCSTVGGTKAILNLAQDAIQDNGYLSATDVDSSGGRSLWTYKGVLTRTSNWNLMPTSPKKQVIKHGNMIMKY